MGEMRKFCVSLLALVMVLGVLPASPAAAQTSVAAPAEDEQIENTSRAIRRALNRVMPNTRHVVDVSERQFNGGLRNAPERCPGVPNRAPDWEVGRGRLFLMESGRLLLVQAIWYPTVRDARQGVRLWHRQMVNECSDYVDNGTRVQATNRRRSPAPGVGDQRKAVNLRLTDATTGDVTGGSVLTAHRIGNIVIYAGVTHGGSPGRPNRGDLALAGSAIEFMAPRAEALLGN